VTGLLTGPEAHVDNAQPPESSLDTLVARPGLATRLETGVRLGVTIVCAPPGSGKTVLLRSWATSTTATERVAWVSVDRDEQDAQHFWLSVLEQLRTAAGADSKIEQITPAPTFDGDEMVRSLVEQLRPLDRQLVLVIDDLHDLLSVQALRQLKTLLRTRPANLSVILATRRDPELGLHRLRLAGELTELRSADLRFTLEETRRLLDASGVVVPGDAVELLHERTEGWVAGLRLVTLALDDHPDPVRLVSEFSGNERTVADYLLTEVLQRLPKPVQALLLRTSLLRKVSGPLADFLTETSGSAATLRSMEDAGAFVVSLDPGRTSFRYHHLFADMLQSELRRTYSADEVSRLHRAAAQWNVEHGDVVDAIRHAQAAGDWQLATRLLADHSLVLALDGRQETIHALLSEFPTHEEKLDPELAVVLAADELSFGSLVDAEGYLALAERQRDLVPPERRPRFGLALDIRRLSLARQRGDVSLGLDQFPGLIDLDESCNWSDLKLRKEIRALALSQLGIVERWSWMTEEAIEHLEEGRELARQIGRPYIEIGCLAHLASTFTRRSFTRAIQPSREAIAIADAHGWGADPVITPALATLGISLMQTGDFDEAERWLRRAQRSLRADTEPAVGFQVHLGLGTLHMLRRTYDGSMQSLREAGRVEKLLTSAHPLGRQGKSCTIEALVRMGDIDAAKAMLRAMRDDDRASGELQQALACIRLAEGSPELVVETLRPVLDGSLPVHHSAVVVRSLLIEAEARELLGETGAGDAAVERALDLAEPDGLILPFALSGTRRILERLQGRTGHAAFLAHILDVLDGSSWSGRLGGEQVRLDALSPSELRVLRYLAGNLRAGEIAAELYLSIHTVKTHMRHIYEKLDVHTRSEAVERARSVSLLAPLAHRT
jgi:LuxR family transcriptional regulator, maltose regulon positive regulatory protein